MKRLREAHARGDRGAVLVEAVLAVPIFFALLFALADYSIAEVGNSSGANAAREGARVAILNYANADQVGSPNYSKVVDAVNARLGGMVEANPSVAVSCLQSDGTSATGYGCDPSRVKRGIDLVKVAVSWTQISALGLISNRHRTDSAIMRIVGVPTNAQVGGTFGCTLSNPTATPSTVDETGGTLDQTGSTPAITFRITVSSTTECGIPLITLPAESGLTGSTSMVQNGTTTLFEFEYPPSSGSVTQSWTGGSKTAQIQEQGGTQTASIPFTVTAPTACTFGTVTPNPVNVALQNKNSDHVKSNFSVDVLLPVNSRSACATPQIHTEGFATTPIPATSPVPMVWSTSNNAYVLTISSSSYKSPWQDSDVGTLVIVGPGGVSTSVAIKVKG